MKFAVLGAGHGGFATSCHLTLQGYKVNLWNRSPETIGQVMELGGINLEVKEELKGVAGLDSTKNGFVKLNKITIDIKEAVKDTDVVMVTTPSYGHETIANTLAPYIEDGQIIVLCTGNPGGALAFANFLKKKGAKKDVVMAETQTLVYATGKENPTTIQIRGYKNGDFKAAAFPATETGRLLDIFRDIYPNFVPAKNTLETGLSNQNTVMHVAIMLLNAGLIEKAKGDMRFYQYVTRPIARVMEAVDRDRFAIGRAMNINMEPTKDAVIRWYSTGYGPGVVDLGNTFESFCTRNPAYFELDSPKSLDHKFITEDVPFGLVPMAYLGELFGVDTLNIRLVADLACIMMETDYWKTGRTLEKMGIVGMKPEEVIELVTYGEPLGTWP